MNHTPTVEGKRRIKSAMVSINENGLGVTFIVNDTGSLVGVVSDGDIRRALLSGKSLETEITEIMNPEPMKIKKSWPPAKVDEFINSSRVQDNISEAKGLVIPIVPADERKVLDKLCT